eukprot:Gb_40432 [translate_table: standard]
MKTNFAMATTEMTPPLSSSFPLHQQQKYKTHTICFAGIDCRFITRNAVAAAQFTSEPKLTSQDSHANALYREIQMDEAFQQRGYSADASTYHCLLQRCTNMETLKQVHAHLFKCGHEKNIFLGTKLVDLYAMCDNMEQARLVFDRIYTSNAFLWNVMIKAYAVNGPCEESLTLYQQMQREGIQPNKFTFPFVLKACAGLSALQEGKEIHNHIVRTGFESDVFVGNSLVAMYANCGSVQIARQVFDNMSERDVVSWNAMIDGYNQNGHADEALTLFNRMQLEGIKPNLVTLVSVLPACAHLTALQQGKWIHGCIIRSGFEWDVVVLTALVDMYAKCRSMEEARQLFDKMSKRNVVSWTAMIAGYAQNGQANEALTLFSQMNMAEIKPNSVTMGSVLLGCAHLAALQQGKWMHGYVVRNGFESDVVVGTALIDMYAKCGSVETARRLFDLMSERDVVSWSAMIAGYGMHGYGEDALALFSQMQQAGMKPNSITFVSVLSACSHAGLVDEGWQYFDCMIKNYSIIPRVEHYACMVDLLGRAGCLDEAQEFIRKMPLQPGATVWGALLAACRIHCNIELGEHIAEHLFYLEPENAGCYVLLSNIYAAAGRWDDVAKVRTMMKGRGLKKKPGCSFIEVNNRVHAFFVGDRSHPQSEKIYATLENLAGQMKEAGYVPNTNFVLHDVEEELKENMICSHSEKIAIAFGLMNTIPGTSIRITKNLRVCGDCHSATKFISKIVKREIIVRDANRFHHFKGGLCSCRDYW